MTQTERREESRIKALFLLKYRNLFEIERRTYESTESYCDYS